ncbi:MAG: hypothetical protein K0041_00700 [Acidithiobacillus sp.]|nr:hypothetical protein [Acidithiobacillus sp.]
MNIRQHHQYSAKTTRSTSGNDLLDALEALEEKQEFVQEKLHQLVNSIDHAHPDQIMDQVLLLDRELCKYRRFFHILKQHFMDSSRLTSSLPTQ